MWAIPLVLYDFNQINFIDSFFNFLITLFIDRNG
jgi:hypothetical protein